MSAFCSHSLYSWESLRRQSALFLVSHLFLSLLLCAVLAPSARADTAAAPVPRYIPDVVPGARCVGYLPCPFIGPLGVNLKLRLLAAIDDDKRLSDFRLDLAGTVSLLHRVEVGVILPISFYQPLQPSYEMLQAFVTSEVLPRGHFANTYASGFLSVRFPLGAFNGSGSPLGSSSATVDVGASLWRHVWLLSVHPAMWVTAGADRLELHAGLGLYLRGDIVWPYAQVRMDSRLGCSAARDPQCGYGFAVLAGAAFPSDFGTSGVAYAKGLSGAHAAHAISAELAIGYNEAVARKHGDSVTAAQRWWQRQFDALRVWQAQRRAEAAYGALLEELRNDLWWQEQARRSRCQGPACGQVELPPILPPLSSPENPQNDEGSASQDPTSPMGLAPTTRYLPSPSQSSAALSRRPARTHTLRSSRWDPRTESVPALRTDHPGIWEASLAPYNEAFTQWQREQEERAQAQRLQGPPLDLPPMEKAYLNTLSLLWFEAATMFLQAASPDSAARVEEMRAHFRPFKYRESEAEMGRGMETALGILMTMGPELAVGAEHALVRTAGNIVATEGAATAAQMRALGTLAAETEANSARASEGFVRGLLAKLGPRFNPRNYRLRLRGLGSNFGNVELEYIAPNVAEAETPAWTGTPNAATYAQHKQVLKVTEQANPLVESLRTEGKLPDNYITKNTAENLGWSGGKALNNYAPGAQIGGDVFRNIPNTLPEAPGRVWYEADVGLSNTMSRSKQAGTRLLYSNDGELYITNDHYNSTHRIGRWK